MVVAWMEFSALILGRVEDFPRDFIDSCRHGS